MSTRFFCFLLVSVTISSHRRQKPGAGAKTFAFRGFPPRSRCRKRESARDAFLSSAAGAMRRAAARVALLLASVTPLRAASLSCLNECSHHGECSDGVCVCEAAFTGNDCSLDSCGVGNTCSTHGSCHDFACKCDSGWTGFDCSQQRCPNDCFNRGDCVSGKCICAPGYFGDDCALETCANNCTGHGTCEDNSCQCFAGWEGNDCSSKTCPSGCAGHGTCLNGNCLCRHGWIGQTCELSSCANGCSGHGSCVNLKCACDDGWSGARCPTASPPHSHLHPSPLHLYPLHAHSLILALPPQSATLPALRPPCVCYGRVRLLAQDVPRRLLRPWHLPKRHVCMRKRLHRCSALALALALAQAPARARARAQARPRTFLGTLPPSPPCLTALTQRRSCPWPGAACSLGACPNGCNAPNGECVSNRCQCAPGFTGAPAAA